MRFSLRAWGLLSYFFMAFAMAAGGSDAGSSRSAAAPAASSDPVIRSAREGIAREDWAGTQALLRSALQNSPGNADYHNLLAFAIRKGPNPDMAQVFAGYAEALRLDPKHRGAREYLGEAYLQVGNLPKAREQLAALDKLCFLPCEEYTDLKAQVEQNEASQPK